jgi:multidrug resistance efflux pump
MENTQETIAIKPAAKSKKKRFILFGAAFLTLAAVISGFAYWQANKNLVYTDKAQVFAPKIALAPESSGILEQIFVHEGDEVVPNTVVARVGNELVKTKIPGLVVTTVEDGGKLVNAGESVVTIINPDELRVVAQIDENKGLKKIQVGQSVEFTVDAFGSKKYTGVVDEVSPASRAGDIVFNISDQRQVAQFDIKVRFNADNYPELKNGMSAKVWIHTN